MNLQDDIKLKLKNLPQSPGIYLFKNADGKIIYIGKARNLRHRVRSYFGSAASHNYKTIRLVSQAVDFDLMVTDSEVEALILEANMVRQHKPRYNVLLKDDKHFPYVKITTNEPFPRVLIVRRIEKDGATYFGPYTNSKGMRKTITFLTRLFTIRTCNLIIPAPPGKKNEVCLDYYIKRCGGPCVGHQSREKYSELVDAVLMVLSGRSRDVIDLLRSKMETASEELDFEEAAHLRDQIEAIDSVMIKQKVDTGEAVDRDIVAVAREERDAVAVVMQLRQGVLIGRQDFQLVADAEDSNELVIETFLAQYYNHQPNLPDELFLPCEIPQLKLFERWLKKLRGAKVRIHTPRKGTKLKLLGLAASNARLLLDELLIQKKKLSDRTSKMVTSLKDDLGLKKSPRTIVCFDISNTGDTDSVGSCVYFENGRPKKKEYRHFRIKGVAGQDDFKMMREIIGRYFFRVRERMTEDKPYQPPDLVVVDGGKGQLSSAVAELRHLGFSRQPVIGLAKRLEEVFLPGKSDAAIISKSSPGLILLKRVRDEAHRFAVRYNRKVRSKRTIKSALDNITGIGSRRREMLLKKYGSVAMIKNQSIEELSTVKGITPSLAKEILKSLKK